MQNKELTYYTMISSTELWSQSYLGAVSVGQEIWSPSTLVPALSPGLTPKFLSSPFRYWLLEMNVQQETCTVRRHELIQTGGISDGISGGISEATYS